MQVEGENPSEKMKFPKKRRGKYRVIYADPAWPYRNFNHGKARRGAAKEYKLMAMDEIARLPVADIAAKDAALFLWTTGPMLKEAMRVIEWWGFQYYSIGFIWIKWNRKPKAIKLFNVQLLIEDLFTGNGWMTRSNAEICLLATRGHPRRKAKDIHQVVFAPPGRHSEKPAEVRKRIVKLMGDVPRIELFARGRPAPGWVAWGDQVKR